MQNKNNQIYMDPMRDIVFKSILRLDKEHIIIKILVKELMGIEFTSFKVDHPGFIAKGKNKKGEETDYYCEVNGQKITIECNKNRNPLLFERNLSHLRRMIVDYGWNKYQINLDGYDIVGKDKLVYEFGIEEKDGDSKLYSNLLRIYHINLKHLEKIMKKDYNNLEKYSLFERVGMIFMTKNKEELEKVVKDDAELKKLKDVIDNLNNDYTLLDNYTKGEIEMMAEVEERVEKAVEERVEKAVEERVEKATDRSKQEERISIAKNLLDLSIDINTIEKATGLSKEEIESIVR